MSEQESRLREIMRVFRKNDITRGISPEKLRVILEELGPTYIKLGQIMSLHSDILPERYCAELLRLNSEVTPMPFAEVLEVIEESYGAGWSSCFAEISEQPLGSASIAQVHRAKLLDGDEVIVKVQRKGIYEVMSRDIALLRRAVKLLPPVGDLRNLVDLGMVLDELWAVAQEEMDFLKEASNMEEFQRNNRDVRYVACPKLYREYTTSRVLVMDYVGGCAVNDKETLLAQGYDLREVGSKLVNSFIRQVMEDGFFHADPHPGNVKVADGKIIWIDMGMMGRLSDRERRIMIRGIRGIAMHDVTQVENAVLDFGSYRKKPDRGRLYRDIKQFMDNYGSAGLGNINIAESTAALMDIMKENRIALPHGMTMLCRGLAHIQGVLADISPDINMIEIATGRFTEEYLDSLDWRAEFDRQARRMIRSADKSVEIPGLISDALKEYLAGQGQMNMTLHSSRAIAELVYSSVRNLVIGLCIAALLISSATLCTTSMEPRVLGIPLLGALGYVLALGSSAFLIVRYIVNKLRSR